MYLFSDVSYSWRSLELCIMRWKILKKKLKVKDWILKLRIQEEKTKITESHEENKIPNFSGATLLSWFPSGQIHLLSASWEAEKNHM